MKVDFSELSSESGYIYVHNRDKPWAVIDGALEVLGLAPVNHEMSAHDGLERVWVDVEKP